LSPASCLDLNISQLIHSHAFEIYLAIIHCTYIYICTRCSRRRSSNTIPSMRDAWRRRMMGLRGHAKHFCHFPPLTPFYT
jgi:hypothetical protein